MGLEIDRDRFVSRDYEHFAARLQDCLTALESLLERPGFGEGAASIGAELEVALIDPAARPLPLNLEVLAETLDPRMTVELDRFNVECNLRYGPLAGRPFEALRADLDEAHSELGRAAARHSGRVAMVGILPTILREDLDREGAMTDTPRYRALAHALRSARNAPFRLDIAGDDPLSEECEGVTFEGAATSLQIHLRVPPGEFAALFNAIQLSTPPALAVAGNSPLFMGHRLWEETRVALFKQAVDERDSKQMRDRRLPRVGFGTDWVDESAIELFREAIEIFPPLLPVLYDEDPGACIEAGGVPKLEEIRLHQGTVWSWNRPVYDPAAGGHLRIELRALPSGPTIVDMLANTAFAVGLGYGLMPFMDRLTDRLDFDDVHASFYRAAQSGLDAELAWPDAVAGVEAPGDRLPADQLVVQLVDVARKGLLSRGVESSDFEPLLEVIRERAESGQTGAVWQRRILNQMGTEDADCPEKSDEHRLERLVERYVELSNEGQPVHRWPAEV